MARYYRFKSLKLNKGMDINFNVIDQKLFLKEFSGLMEELIKSNINRIRGFYCKIDKDEIFFVYE